MAAGDAIAVVHRPDHGVTIGDTFNLRATDPAVLTSLLDQQPDLADDLARAVRRDLPADGATRR